MSTQPRESPESRYTKKDPALEPVAEETARRLVEGAEQQVGAGEQVEAPETEAYDPRATKEGDAELDDALEGTFPANDPPSQTSKGRAR